MDAKTKTAATIIKVLISLSFTVGVAWATVKTSVKEAQDTATRAEEKADKATEHLHVHDVDLAVVRTDVGYIKDAVDELRGHTGRRHHTPGE